MGSYHKLKENPAALVEDIIKEFNLWNTLIPDLINKPHLWAEINSDIVARTSYPHEIVEGVLDMIYLSDHA